MNTAALVAANAARWSRAKMTRAIFAPAARRLVAAKERYQKVAAVTGQTQIGERSLIVICLDL